MAVWHTRNKQQCCIVFWYQYVCSNNVFPGIVWTCKVSPYSGLWREDLGWLSWLLELFLGQPLKLGQHQWQNRNAKAVVYIQLKALTYSSLTADWHVWSVYFSQLNACWLSVIPSCVWSWTENTLPSPPPPPLVLNWKSLLFFCFQKSVVEE